MFGLAARKDGRVIYFSAKVVLSEVLIALRRGFSVAAAPASVAGWANERSWNAAGGGRGAGGAPGGPGSCPLAPYQGVTLMKYSPRRDFSSSASTFKLCPG